LSKYFEIHPLTLEDVLNTDQRPKMDDYNQYLYLVLKQILRKKETNELIVEQLSIILGPNYVLSFQETIGDVFDPIRDRIRNNKGRIRKMGADFLAYALVDAVVDNYFVILEDLGEQVELLEDELVVNPSPELLRSFHHLRRELIYLRKAVWPLREMLNKVERSESSLIADNTVPFVKDVYDHTIQIIDTIELQREIVASMMESYLTSIQNRMNEVMKLFTVLAVIFNPLMVITGAFGMNFEHIPGAGHPWGFILVWVFMIALSVGMLLYFKKKKWL
jgi:magnesium transporter